jgi:hypothetical protein
MFGNESGDPSYCWYPLIPIIVLLFALILPFVTVYLTCSALNFSVDPLTAMHVLLV